jgi:hypothetical protein
MSGMDLPCQPAVGTEAPALAGAPALPCLLRDNSIRRVPARSHFRVTESVRLYIEAHGLERCGFFTVTVADDCKKAKEFQRRWNSWLTNVGREMLPSGVWIRQRQRRGAWHLHAVTDVGFDIRTGFPWEEIAMRNYGGVDPRLKDIWKSLRESAKSYGFGRTELLPIRATGNQAARYVGKYLAPGPEDVGEDRCRRFGAWGEKARVGTRFTMMSHRIWCAKVDWLLKALDLECTEELTDLYGKKWPRLLRFGIQRLVLPAHMYQVFSKGEPVWDWIGWYAYNRDISCGFGDDIAQSVNRSRHNLFYDVGKLIFGEKGNRTKAQAVQFAVEMAAKWEANGNEPF